MASTATSLLKSSSLVNKSEWLKGQNLRYPSVSVVRCNPGAAAPSALTIHAGAYDDELIKTAVCFSLSFFSYSPCISWKYLYVESVLDISV